ncbi:DgyrCDS14598 [Dimorphilus gyrociliatus]|uniref:DgyrCDS14598 n=1 Tax=Dimorphilus gyrociliatus TaxID=2664684 RepID=A0A7I8WEB1_9ANNE|nr:DgyrCDS14598 [Dimorphilus gyrociliatus]
MAKFCFECRKKINKLKQGTCSHCSHKLHWTCLSDGLCSICSSIQIRSLKIVLRRCDNSCTIKDATKESTIEGNIKEPIKNAVEKDKTLANITVTSMDVDHEQVVSHFSADAIEANELPLKDMNTDEINCAASTMEATLDDERIPTVEDVEDSFESLPEEIDEADGHFKVFENGSQREKKLLVHNNNSFTIKGQYKSSTIWICSVRNKKIRCPASIIQRGSNFHLGSKSHIHPPKKNLEQNIEIKLTAKQSGKCNINVSGKRLAENAILPYANMGNILKVDTCKEMINYHRRKTQPTEPIGRNFLLNNTFIPDDFLRKDIFENGERIIIFSTLKQLNLLSVSKIWYVDGTFSIVKQPFKQLFSIHSFLKKEGALKQVPLLFAFMTSKKKKAYNILFRVRTLNELLEYKTPKKIVLDYERAVWKAALDNWESVTLTGCLFHWNQAVYRKIQELGYSSDFKKKRGQWFEMRQLMALPFLPFHIIPIEFGRIKDYLQSVKKLGDLIKYFERNWMMDRIWSPKQWSIYKNAIRTNNDVEGFHNRLNGNLRANSSFYLVVDELKREADLIPAYQRMLSERKILRYQRRQYKNMQNEIFKIWEKFEAHQMTSSQVLEKCCQLYSEMK